jgi:hypothetical protein
LRREALEKFELPIQVKDGKPFPTGLQYITLFQLPILFNLILPLNFLNFWCLKRAESRVAVVDWNLIFLCFGHEVICFI